MLSGLTGWHFLVVLIVVLLLFGATKLPALAKGLGESMRIFKSEIKKDETPGATSPTPGSTSPTPGSPSPFDSTTTGPTENPDLPHTTPKP
jgi:sec-independent protein translocase protein TatA